MSGKASATNPVSIRADLPHPPGEVSKIRNVSKKPNVLALRWRPPVDTGGAKISGYVISIDSPTGGKIVALSTATPASPSAIIKGVTRGQYQVSIAAANNAGVGPGNTAKLTVGGFLGKIFARLTKKSFKSSQAAKVKLHYRFSPKSMSFAYVLTVKKGAKWLRVRSVKKTGTFAGSHTMTVRQLFKGKAIKVGRYRLKLSADTNRKLLAFRVT